jgi:hypothetical protein
LLSGSPDPRDSSGRKKEGKEGEGKKKENIR